ncbi:MAG: POTRA domain-containing protein, partial [Thiohalobacterales bacterium]|nr:POTRA domain-containing protein [Thiohalobacterales bacterium]
MIALLVLGTRPTMAQPAFQSQRPVDEPLELPEYETEQPPPLELPTVPAPPPGADLSRQARVFVREFRLEGNSVFSDTELAAVTGSYVNREISSGELQELRYRLTLYYVERGYINSGAVIPDQQVRDGIITLQIIEGELSEINVSGERRLRPAYIRDRAALGGGPPLNIVTLGEQLQILQQNPRIERLNATLEPGAVPGESQLNVRVEEAQPYELWLDLDNARSPSVGGEGATLRGLHRNLTGHGDTLEADLGGSEGLVEWNLAYTRPLNARDTRLRLSVQGNDSEVVETPFDILDIENEEITFSL